MSTSTQTAVSGETAACRTRYRGQVAKPKAKPRLQFDCSRCPAHCCTYPSIPISPADIRRLAKGLGESVEYVHDHLTKYSKIAEEDIANGRSLRHKKDEIFGQRCQFLDPETRMCTVYEFRPAICRSHPGGTKCGYWEFLKAERELQGDPELIAYTNDA